MLVPSKTIAEPDAGVRFKAPEFAVIVLPSIPTLSTVRAVRVPSEVTLPCAAVESVPASVVADTVPVVVMAPAPTSMEVNPEVMLPALRAPVPVIEVATAVLNPLMSMFALVSFF